MLCAYMQLNFAFTALSTLILVMIGYISFYPYANATAEHYGDQNGDETSDQHANKKKESTRTSDNEANSQIRIRGDQIISCEGDLTSCHNLLTNIICSNVKYCIVGEITPFLMSNPL
jgi:hypothetical protein